MSSGPLDCRGACDCCANASDISIRHEILNAVKCDYGNVYVVETFIRLAVISHRYLVNCLLITVLKSTLATI